MERVHVSGTVPERLGEENQVWNCVKGEGLREDRWRVPTLNWAA